MRNRRFTKAPLVLVILLAAGLLAACTKPLPTITVFGGKDSVIVDASAYQFSGGKMHERISDFDQAPDFKTTKGSTLLIDVPKSVAENAWIVAAFSLDADGNKTAIAASGTSVIRDSHTTRVPTPDSAGDFYLTVTELRGNVQAGGWLLHVQLTD